MRLRQFLLEEPSLDRSQRHIAHDESLLRLDRRRCFGRASQKSNSLVLEHLTRAQTNACAVRPGDDLDRQDRIAAQSKEIFVDADLLQPEYFGPYCSKALF